jgi:hypothetical protein
MSITLNAKVFALRSSPTPSSQLFGTTSRGATLPDTLLISHRVSKSPSVPDVTVRNSAVSIQRTFIDAVTGKSDVVQFGLTAKIPSNAPAADIAAALADLTDYMASAITARASNIARVTDGTLE